MPAVKTCQTAPSMHQKITNELKQFQAMAFPVGLPAPGLFFIYYLNVYIALPWKAQGGEQHEFKTTGNTQRFGGGAGFGEERDFSYHLETGSPTFQTPVTQKKEIMIKHLQVPHSLLEGTEKYCLTSPF